MEKWYNIWFNSPYYHILYANRDHQEAADFIDTIAEHFHFKKDQKALDAGCGRGRHAIYFNKKGLDITGIDLSPENIAFAKSMENAMLHFQEHDIRKVLCSNYFDYVFNLFTSFGYFKNESDDLKAIHMFSTALKKGGILLLDYINVAAFNSENVNETETKTIQGIDFQIQKSYNANFLYKTIKFNDKGQAFEFQEEVKIIHLAKFKEYLSAQNLELIEVFGDYQLSPYLENSSPRLILIARKK